MRTQHAIHALQNFPVWSVGFISDTRLVLGGGGGSGRSGVKNKLRLYEIQDQGNVIELINESELERDEDAPMTMAVHPTDGALVCGVNSSIESLQKGTNEHCRLYVVRDNTLSPVGPALSYRLGLNSNVLQNVTTFSKDFNLIAVGSTDNEVVVLSYPSLSVVATPFHIPSGQLYGLDFSPSSLLITTDTMLYMISLPLKIAAKDQEGSEDEPHEVKLPELEIEQQIPLPPLDVLGGKGDRGAVRVFNPLQSETMYTVINSAPPSGRSRNLKAVERKSYLVRWERATTGKSRKRTWHFKKARNIGKRAITVFDISESGKLLAYGASDASVGVLDARTLAPLLTILKAHDFPPTALQFNPRSSLLVSGSADASVRVMVIPMTFSSCRL
ncbi:hypothetical protein BS47DRAFT_1301358 [Hydnum rufescens UP504]|uniref:WD40 repeat-like protein n=1 Tax=Hydnum rufescens UP504 TaxID=1448309 RepID=A0A9P6DNY3_9AGAM|nr:hypothetical protein BS47DRAFT_1301358 [Hydnum rufescens UP504]